MSFGFGFGLPSWQTLSGGFNPSSLFVGGVQGAFYDPSDASTLFSDTAGTTPSPTPGGGALSVVGLMLDKSQGLALGSELVTNGDFSSGTTGWTAYASTLSVSGGEVTVTNSGVNYGEIYQTVTTVVGQMYKISATLRVGTAATVNLRAETALTAGNLFQQTTSSASNVVISGYFVATGTSTVVGCANANTNNGTGIFDNISVKSIAGNHAISYNTTTARPELSARVNLLTYSEQFDNNAAWSKVNFVVVTANTDIAPDGTTTADTASASTTGAFKAVRRTPAGLVANTQFVYSVYVKPGTTSWVNLRFWDTGPDGINAWFNVATGTVGTVQAGCIGTITSAGNGWWRCVITRTVGATIAYNEIDIGVVDGDNTYTATAGASILIWGADLRRANIGTSVPAYQRIADQYTYDSSGFPRYLIANGTATGMYTPNNLDLSGTDKVTVFAGVRKTTTTTAGGVIAEFSATWFAYSGTFVLYTPDGTAQNFGWGSRGNTANVPYVSPLAASQTSYVATGIGNIAGNVTQLRLNGAVAATDTTNAGTGNYGTFALNIGVRSATATPSLFLNGYIYSLIVVGAASTAAQISSTESWINGKEGGVY